jgi:hypothetical protein
MYEESAMRIQTVLIIAICAGFVFMSQTVAQTVVDGEVWHKTQTRRESNHRAPFRYVIVYNEIVGGEDDPREAFRYVEVLLDERAFSEKTLKELFRLLSKRFREPKDMDVAVYTSLEQIDTPEERDAGKISEGPGDPALDRYPSALLIRKGGCEFFRYTPQAPSTEMKTVVLKGLGEKCLP